MRVGWSWCAGEVAGQGVKGVEGEGEGVGQGVEGESEGGSDGDSLCMWGWWCEGTGIRVRVGGCLVRWG